MNNEILQIIKQLEEVYQGDPWFGRSLKSLLNDVDENIAFEKPADQHSCLELLWHIINWRAFTINRLEKSEEKDQRYFEENDWQPLDHTDKNLWKKGLQKLHETQSGLIEILKGQQDALLNEIVDERKYNFRKLLNGMIQHDIYHIGQVAYLTKLLVKK